MDYKPIAEELLRIHADLTRMQINQRMDGFARGEHLALSYIYEMKRPVYPKEISKGMQISPARVATLLKHLENKKWITRTTDKEDTRQILVSLTETGVEELLKEKREIVNTLVDVLSGLGESDAKELLRIRKKMLQL